MPQAANTSTKHASQIWAIYHRLEEEVAEALATAGEVVLLGPPDIPDILKFNNVGEPALCAVVITGDKLAKFHRSLADAYAA
jgi:hypothetical protein